ncbi:hypothetical protein SYNPS1DRAFT_30704 [Syncephalis pseudoplumigaleata]|uniref:Inner centromere protein ARK-binding domain-containing protein n=1 Tax=Syncephalis pseudoplumigaleata TaxID=1712513 RepID=A0A4P9YU53_9FUNG|nr:hypothetical protein SYNPS1DRAFT_30704 [Syncephalis pseudoplumigaleata]|eukprot:RKP23543.1 hypothetical protein SYNPS1DRAFT_30704 [Syncephalis pseudoplumigaleata]
MPRQQGRRAALEALYPWAAAEQLHFAQLGDAAVAELESAFKLESQWLDELRGTLCSKDSSMDGDVLHSDTIATAADDANQGVHQAATMATSESHGKRPHTSMVAEDTDAVAGHTSSIASPLPTSAEEPSPKRNRSDSPPVEQHDVATAHVEAAEPPSDVAGTSMSDPPSLTHHASISPRLAETSVPPASSITTLSTPASNRLSATMPAPVLTGNHPFIDDTVMSTPTTTLLSSKEKHNARFPSTLRPLSKPQWHDLSPIDMSSSPRATTTIMATTTTTTATAAADVTAKATVATVSSSSSSSASTLSRPLSSGDEAVGKKDEDWVSPGVVRHQSLFTHFTSLSTMMTSNQKLNKHGPADKATHTQMLVRNSSARRDLIAELQESVTGPRASSVATTPSAVRSSPFKPLGISFSQHRAPSMRDIVEENEGEEEEKKEKKEKENDKRDNALARMTASPLSDEEERLREEDRVKSFFTASTEALKQRLKSLRAKSSVFVAAGSSDGLTPESNILGAMVVAAAEEEEQQQHGEKQMDADVQKQDPQPATSDANGAEQAEEEEEDEEEQVFQDAHDHTPRRSEAAIHKAEPRDADMKTPIGREQEVFVDALQSPSPLLALEKQEREEALEHAPKTASKAAEPKTAPRGRPPIKALLKAHEAAKKEQEVNDQREERKRRIEAMRMKQAQEKQQASSGSSHAMRPSYATTNRVKKIGACNVAHTAMRGMLDRANDGTRACTIDGAWCRLE